MRIKKQLFVLILLFANTVLLAHGILPHAHHDGVICFANKNFNLALFSSQSHLEDIQCSEGIFTDDLLNHDNNLEECNHPSLLQRYGADEVKEISELLDSSLFQNTLLSTHLTCFCLHSYLLDTKPEQVYVNNYSSPLVAIIYGLRAPPHILG